MGNKETKKGISRRDFLKGAAVSAVGVATAGLLGACGSEPTPSAIPTASVSSTPAVSGTLTGVTGAKYEIINTDLLIIGAGFSASAAAYQAIESGQRVAVIEKAPYGHGGGMGFNWDVIATWQMPDYLNQESKLKMVVNKQLYMNAGTTDPNAIMGPVLLNRGEVFHERADDGSLIWYVDYPSTKGVQGVMPRIELDTLKESQLVTVYDRTMITDVLINDGQCIGAMGVYLPTGDFRVYRSKATILATGASCWFYGWNTVSANSINSPDNTSDVDMACFRRGAGIGDAEYAAFDFATTYPEGLAYGWNTMLNPDANEYFAFADRDGVQMITEDSGVDLVRCTYDRPYFNSTLGKMMYAGAMTDAGGLLANLDGVELRPAMERNLAVFEKFGVDPYAENLPIHDEMYEHGGTPVIDDNMMSVDFPGLFCARGAGTAGADGQNNVSKNNRFGSYAARCAIDYMKSATMPETIDFTPADKEY
ncbi:MAG: FAD-binding protein, partial [Clostridia bacterium]|nr:FAD-binding protein [Clostridia bacterium]